jgi:hypothetical protein
VGGLFTAITREIVSPFFEISPKEGDDGGEIDEEVGWRKGWLELVKDIPLRGNW